MPTIHASVDVDAPLEFAELEWSEFMLESLLNGYARGLIDEEPLLDEDDMKAGDVEFTTEGDRLVKVDVRLDYTPRSTGGADQGGLACPGDARARPREVPPVRDRPLRAAELPAGLRPDEDGGRPPGEGRPPSLRATWRRAAPGGACGAATSARAARPRTPRRR